MTENFDVAAAISLTDEESQSTAAHYAAQSGAYATLRLLATYHAPIVKKGNYNGETPLHHAAANGQEECIRVLTDELGCERTVSDKSGWIPLLYADYAHRRGAVLTLMAEDLQTQLGAMHAILDSRVSRSKVMKVSLFFFSNCLPIRTLCFSGFTHDRHGAAVLRRAERAHTRARRVTLRPTRVSTEEQHFKRRGLCEQAVLARGPTQREAPILRVAVDALR